MGIIKRVFLTTALLCSVLYLSSLDAEVAFAGGNPETAAQSAEVEAAAKEKAEKEAKAIAEKAESKGNVAEPPSGPDVKINTIEENVEIETPASVTGQKFQGTGTVTDFSTSGSKAFYTITDKDQNVFYLIIDLDKTDNNVYFLSDINKSDLEASVNPPVNVPPVVEGLDSARMEQPKEDGGGSFLLMVLLVAVIALTAYYYLVFKKKKGQGNVKNEGEDEMDENYDEDENDRLYFVEDNKDDKGNQ